MLLDLTILFAASAQLALDRRGEQAIGAVLYGAASVALLASLALQREVSSPAQRGERAGHPTSSEWRLRWWQVLALGGVVLAQGAVALLVYRDSPLVLPVTILWVLSMVFAVGVASRIGQPEPRVTALLSHLRSKLAVPRLELVAVTAIIIVGAALRLVNLEAYPSMIFEDEGSYGLIARSILQGKGPNPFGTTFVGSPALITFLEAPFILVFGQTISAMRLLAGLVGTVTLIACYALSRSLLGPRIAIMATAFVAGTVVAIHFGRVALDVSEVPLLATMSLYFLWRGYGTDAPAWWLSSGLTAGGVFYFHYGGPLVVLTIALFMLYALATRQLCARRWFRGVTTLCVGFVLAVMPLAAHMASHSDVYVSHIEDRMIFGHWDGVVARWGTSDPMRILWGQFTLIPSAFTYAGDIGPFYSFVPDPMLNGLTASLFVLGLTLMVVRLGDPHYALLFFWFWSVVIPAIALTDASPQFHRVLQALIPALIGAAAVLDWLATSLVRLLGHRSARAVVAAALLLPALSAGYSAYIYFGSDRFGADVEARFLEGTVRGRYLAGLAPTVQVLIVTKPFIDSGFSVPRYLAPDVKQSDVQNLPVELPRPLTQPLAVVVNPGADTWLPTLEAIYPDGRATPVTVGNGQVVFTTFEVPAGAPSVAWPNGHGLAGQVTAGSLGMQDWRGSSPVVAYHDISGLVPHSQAPFFGRWSGVLNVPSTGSYTLELWTDAVATLDVDGQALIQGGQSDQGRSLKQTANLTAGAHDIAIEAQWSHAPGYIDFVWQEPGAGRTLVPADDLLPPI